MTTKYDANLAYLMNIASKLPDAKRIEYAQRFMKYDNKVVSIVNGKWLLDGIEASTMMAGALDSAVAGYYGQELS